MSAFASVFAAPKRQSSAQSSTVDVTSLIEIVAATDPAAALAWSTVEQTGVASRVFDRQDIVSVAAEACTAAGGQANIVVVHGGDGRPQSILPLRINRKFGACIAQGLVAPLAQYCDVVGRPISSAVLEHVGVALREKLGVDLLLLRKVRRDGGLWPALASRAASQNSPSVAPYIDFTRYPTFADYEASFSRASRRSRKQRWRKLEERFGSVKFSVRPGADAGEHLATAIAWKRAWCAAQGLSSPVFDDPVWCRALQRAASLPHAFVSVLSGDGRPLALELGFEARGEYVSYFGAYDVDFAAFGVGQLQLFKTIEWAHARGVERFDLLAPDSDYKRQWARSDTVVEIDDFALPLSPVGWGLADLRRRVRPMARHLILGVTPEVRLAGQRYGVPASIVAAIGMAVAVSLE